MPKEHVRDRYEGTEDNPSSMVEVGWVKEYGSVQVGVVASGESPIDRPQMWVDLNRNGINALIRLLRKARDGSFGRDE